MVGRTVTLDELFEQGYDAVYLGVGAGLPRFMNIPGENLIGILSVNEYLTRANFNGPPVAKLLTVIESICELTDKLTTTRPLSGKEPPQAP